MRLKELSMEVKKSVPNNTVEKNKTILSVIAINISNMLQWKIQDLTLMK